jgi:serine/threonine-protein kinase
MTSSRSSCAATPGLVILLLTALVVACGGCAPTEPNVQIDAWRLQREDDALEHAIRLPAHVAEYLPSSPSRYRLRATVTLPEHMRHRTLTLAIPYLMASVTLYAAGREALPLDEDVWGAYRGRESHRWRLPPTDATTIDLELLVEHRSFLSAQLETVPRLSATPQGDAAFRLVAAFHKATAILCAGVLLVGCFYVLLFLLDGRRKSYLWFGIGAVSASYYGFLWAGVTQELLGPYELVGLFVVIPLALLSSIYFSHAYFEQESPSRAFGAAALVLACLAAIFSSPFVIQRLAPLRVAYCFAVVAYQVGLVVRLRRVRRPAWDMNIAVACWVAQALACVPDWLLWCGYARVFGGLHTGCLAIVIYAGQQMVVLTREHTAYVRRVEVLNLELKRQLADRAGDLARALALVKSGPSSGTERSTGEVIGNAYRVQHRLGRGGMGFVYLVTRLSDGQELALKELRSLHGTSLVRFAREAEILARIDHPNVVSIVDFGVAHGGDPYLVMELVSGCTLQEERSRYGDAPWARAVLRQIAAGLEGIHAAGIVHRDLKPSNVLVSYPPGAAEPIVKITDFGISGILRTGLDASERTVTAATRSARLLREPLGSSEITATGDFVGTPKYMAPEVRESATRATFASDMYSLGILARELLATAGLDEESVSRTKLDRSVSAVWQRLLDDCLSARPEDRPTAGQVARAASGPVLFVAERRA